MRFEKICILVNNTLSHVKKKRMRHKFMKYSMFFTPQFISTIKNYLLSGDLLSKHTSIYYLQNIYFYLYTCICRPLYYKK